MQDNKIGWMDTNMPLMSCHAFIISYPYQSSPPTLTSAKQCRGEHQAILYSLLSATLCYTAHSFAL